MILSSLKKQASNHIALSCENKQLTYGELIQQVEQFQVWLAENKITSLALLAENSWQWVVTDLACQAQHVIFTPIPDYFSASQRKKLLKSAQPDVLLSENVLPIQSARNERVLCFYVYDFIYEAAISTPDFTSKITYTSGSTGSPKGVCLSVDNQYKVAKSLVEVIGLNRPKHLCLLPLPTLLENIAGVYAPLLAGGVVYLLSSESRGFKGSGLSSPSTFLQSITHCQPNSMILVPELLLVLINAVKTGWKVPTSLDFIAVGGSKVAPDLIKTAHRLKLPVYQGYGLSECASVVSIASPNHVMDEMGSCGEVLPHLSVKSIKKELVISGNSFLGYLEQPHTWYPKSVYSGDIGEVLHNQVILSGRSKNIIVNSFGRNISPEWVESELLATGLFSQAVLIGDAKPYCSALLVPYISSITSEKIQTAVDAINHTLPDYAQVKDFIILSQPMTYDQGLVTANGRPQREKIVNFFARDINSIYLKTSNG